MNARTEGDAVIVPGGRQRLHESRGYGRPEGDDVRLAPIEAAHLVRNGAIETIEGVADRDVLRRADGATLRVYTDLRDRGFRIRPERWTTTPGPADLVVYERGADPGGAVAHRFYVVGAADRIPPDRLRSLAESAGGGIAVADEEGEVSYFEVDRPDIQGTTTGDPGGPVTATLMTDRVLVDEGAESLYDRLFYGTPIPADGDDTRDLHLSLIEAVDLANRDVLELRATAADAPDRGGVVADRIADRGRDLAGAAFDRRLTVYTALRDRGVVPRSGFKFGSEFRTYTAVESATDPGHSDDLVWVMGTDEDVCPRQIALRVRLAGGVRKRTVFARTDATNGVEWIAVERLTP